eukprot:Nitzschia sp. Nitz4//scaffold73_size107353//38435//40105//NITZ4_004313-RA/size107353-snap-gene-0.92-mRNA-1//1//CDS//3329557455//3839//frame0
MISSTTATAAKTLLNQQSTHSALVLAGTLTSVAVLSTIWTQCQAPIQEESPQPPVEVHLMDKIQQKSYLTSVQDGIPSTLRVLAIDLPEMRTKAFSGTCHIAHDKVFLDEVAPPKTVEIKETNPPTQLKVAQKALVKSLVQCRSKQSQQRVGVELLEASISDLNPYDLRKTQQFGKYKYDPGKYYSRANIQSYPEDEEMSEVDDPDNTTDSPEWNDELEAPWNQYAWAEELRLRINGKVGFDSSMEKSNPWYRMIFGHAYKITIRSVYHFYEWPLPTFAKSNPDGIDGRHPTKCRACNKPHAVIANGAALQRVPSSLRLLQKLCRKADVPLFVVHDPRVWGGNTHQTLHDALVEMRTTVKNQVITNALKQQGSTSFSRGRMLGQAETEAKWRIKEQKRISREMLLGKSGQRRKRRTDDWSQYDATRLERRLVERGVIKETIVEDEDDGSKEVHRTYTPAWLELARRSLLEVEETVEEADDNAEAFSDEQHSTSSNQSSKNSAMAM